MTSASMFRLCKTVGRINLDELCTYRFPLATETEMKPQQLGGPSLCHTKTYLDNFTISIASYQQFFLFLYELHGPIYRYRRIPFFYAFQVNCESANIRLVMKQIYLSVPQAPTAMSLHLLSKRLSITQLQGTSGLLYIG